jgi:Flp pilus assembly protein TadG
VRRSNDDAGQATVEVALAVPLLVIVMLFGVQIALVIRDQIATIAAAREAARAVVVADGKTSVADAAVARTTVLNPSRRSVKVSINGQLVTATVTYRSPTDLPLVGIFIPDIVVRSSATMALET